MKKIILITGLLLFSFNSSYANELILDVISLENFDESQGLVDVKFRVIWQNSWRLNSGPSNWDAAWIFIKYRANSGEWQHATLQAASSPDPNYIFDVSTDQKGGFFYRASEGNGQVAVIDNILTWDYANDGVSINDTIEIKVFGIEMVYVPEGAFYLGTDDGTELDKFRKGNQNNRAYLVSSEDEITIGTGENDLYYNIESTYAGDLQGPISASFPKGYQAFYCMKYEVSEEQYVTYFNTLSEDDKVFNDLNEKGSDDIVNRNTFSWPGIGTNATTNAPERACSFMSKTRLENYLKWAALRPMTEFEFEKAAKGPSNPIPEIYAWGTANVNTIPHLLAATDSSNEYINNLPTNIGNTSYDLTDGNLDGPLRCGIFSYVIGTTVKNRDDSGSSYYGIMELSGNLWERVIPIGASSSRNFNGSNGNGSSIGGFSNVLKGLRGGGWNSPASELRVSDRTFGGGGSSSASGADNSAVEGRNDVGGRGVRTAD